tara:strand:+ start:4998 stop:5780 length:783 start_codon:yes stop_codon:yes gene_type:complete
MKIIGFAQLRNELSKGNLENWFKCMQFCDHIYIYDQASDDGSVDFYNRHSNTKVIRSDTNRFGEEIVCKADLLDLLLQDHPDVDWIFWMDGDTCLDNRLMVDNFSATHAMLQEADKNDVGALSLGHYNLWRSRKHYRIDSSYHSLDSGVIAFWKNNGRLSFPRTSGLHSSQFPASLSGCKLVRTPFKLVHYGFSTEEQIINRYNMYKSLGQSGWKLDRLLCERDLQVRESETEVLPTFIDCATPDPTTLTTVRDLYGLSG